MAADLQQQARDRAKAADQARVDMTEKATAALFENANGILKRLGVPEMKVVFPGTTAQEDRGEADRGRFRPCGIVQMVAGGHRGLRSELFEPV